MFHVVGKTTEQVFDGSEQQASRRSVQLITSLTTRRGLNETDGVLTSQVCAAGFQNEPIFIKR